MKIKFYKHNEAAVLPKPNRIGDAGADLTAISKEWDEENGVVVFGTGLGVQIPDGHVGLLFPRSSVYKQPLSLANSVGVIDYTGEIKAMFRPIDRPRKNYEVGDRIVQLVIVPYIFIEPMWTEELRETNRGQAGFGSSGT